MLHSVLASADASAHAAHQVSSSVTYLFSFLLIMMVAALAMEEKIHCKKSLITGVFAVLCLPLADAFHLLPLGPLLNVFGEELRIPVFIQGIDWEVITIILGSGLFVDVISRSGLFTWIAIKLTKRSGGDPLILLWYYGVMTVLFSAFLNNVTAIIIVGSLTVVSLDKLNKRELMLGFLLTEGLLTNIGGLLTLISSVPNIIVGNLAGISFARFFIVSSLFVVIATAATIFMAAMVFSVRRLASAEQREESQKLVMSFDETDGIESRTFFYSSIVAFILLVFIFATSSVLPIFKDLGLGYVAMAFAIIMLLVYRSEAGRFYSAVDWDLVGFFIFLFVVINVMEHAQVLNLLGQGISFLISTGEYSGQLLLLWGSALTSSVTDNIPLSAVLAKILSAFQPPVESNSGLWWAVIFGANLGGNITPIGSASTLVAVSIIHKNKLKLSFAAFVRAAVPFALLQLILASGYILLVVPFLA